MGGGTIMGIMSRIKFIHTYEHIISIENLLLAWSEFVVGKKSRRDVQEFQRDLMVNILSLHRELKSKKYRHGKYQAFKINDPKPRDIHKAEVRDRVLHHAIYRILYPFFDRTFIADSYSCRKDKGTHRALNRFRDFARIVSKNNTQTCWILKCDIRKFFANIDHEILKEILEKYIEDENILNLLKNIIDSFEKGLPLGNLTSQLLVNIYMNEFDQFVKHKFKVKYYIRYADDFVFLHNDKIYLKNLQLSVGEFLENKLKLKLHPDKVFIKTFGSGVDFLGWVHFPKHRVLRITTKKRILRNINVNSKKESIDSYLGVLSHGNGYKLQVKIKELENLNK